MSRERLALVLVMGTLALPAAAVEAVGGLELPAVPATLLVAAAGGSAQRSVAEPGIPGRQTLHVESGVNEIVPVAVGHLNRLVTPFAAPRVRTVSTATTQVEGPVVYVATPSEEPVTLFITSEESEELALSLTLAPRRIPPREIRLVVDAPAGRVSTGAQRWETAQPYLDTLVQALRSVALGAVPSGFGLRAPGRREAIECAQAGLEVTPGQVLEGHHLEVRIGVVRNLASAPVALEEAFCQAADGRAVLAVAAWPETWLAPGERAELYLVLRTPEPEPVTPRPSLLRAGVRR